MEPQDIEILLDSLQDYLRTHSGHDMPHVQRAVLYSCLHTANVRYRHMPTLVLGGGYGRYSEKNLKNAGSIVFQTLTTVFREKIRKNNCHYKLLSWYRDWQQRGTASSSPTQSSNHTNQVPVNLLQLQCRDEDVAELLQKINNGHRMICINGAPGVGKTYLLHLLIEKISFEFEDVIWCQAADVQTIARLYSYASKQNFSDIGGTSAISALAELLRTQRMLLVIDHAECLFESQTLAGEFRDDCTGYDEWLRRLLATPFLQGCLIWVGQEPPKCFDVPSAVCHTARRLRYDDAAILLKAQDITIDDIEGWEQLVDFCSGNSECLLRQASHLQRFSPEGIPQFLANLAPSLNVTEALQHVLNRLSAAEQLLLVWLLLKPISYEQIRYLDIPGMLPQTLILALASLEKRDLIRLDINQNYCLDSTLLERMLAEHVVARVHAELIGHTALETLFQHPLFHGSASASRQNWQRQYLLQETISQFKNSLEYGFRREQTQRLQTLLNQARELLLSQQRYAVSNVLNLAIALHIPLTEFDLSGLHLRYVDLRQANLYGANLERCTFEETLLPLNLTGRLVADMDAEGEVIAVGDEDGHLFYWQRDGESLRLQTFCTLSTPIDKILFKESGTLILISNQTVYSWWVGGNQAPQPTIQLPELATCLAYSNWKHIAIGLSNGQIILWDELRRQQKVLDAHKNPVYSLSFSSNGRSLASIGSGNRVLIWNLASESGTEFSYHELSSGSRICGAIGWEDERLVRAEVNASRIYLRIASTLEQEHNLHDGNIIALHFSKNGRHLAGSSNSGFIFCWDWKTQSFNTIRQSTRFAEHNSSEHSIPGQLTACKQGRWLLTLPGSQVQLYDLQNHEMFWEAWASSPMCSNCNLRSAQNLTSAERDVMRSLGAELSD